MSKNTFEHSLLTPLRECGCKDLTIWILDLQGKLNATSITHVGISNNSILPSPKHKYFASQAGSSLELQLTPTSPAAPAGPDVFTKCPLGPASGRWLKQEPGCMSSMTQDLETDVQKIGFG
jgi:hypothetical protein